MGQIYKVDSGGVHSDSGQTIGQNRKSTRRGVGWNKVLVMGPTEVATNHHQSGGDELRTAAQGMSYPCS